MKTSEQTKAANPFAHWGLGTNLTPLAEGDRREAALAEGLRKLANRCGITLREPLRIDSNGEFSLAVSNGSERDGFNDPCGQWGEEFAALLNESGGARCGICPTKYHDAKGGWCRLNHFAAQTMPEQTQREEAQFDPARNVVASSREAVGRGYHRQVARGQPASMSPALSPNESDKRDRHLCERRWSDNCSA